MLEINAKGKTGFLLPTYQMPRKGSKNRIAKVIGFTFRVYHKDKQAIVDKVLAGGKNPTEQQYNECFTDYEITHSDLHVRIIDEASFVHKDDGKAILDHDFRTLGKLPRSDKPTPTQKRQFISANRKQTLVSYQGGKRTVTKITKSVNQLRKEYDERRAKDAVARQSPAAKQKRSRRRNAK